MQEVTKTNQTTNISLVLIAAFAAVYIFWGSTYLAIKYAIETLPPFLMAGSRFLIAGSILYVWARFSKDYEKPTLKHWRTSLIVGTLLLLGGNGCVVLAEHYISSSLAALLIAVEPFWIVLLSWLWLGKQRPNWRVALGIALGFAGVYLLVGGQQQSASNAANAGNHQILGAGLVMLAAFSWAAGSIYGLRATTPKSSILTSGMQMLAGGFVLIIVGTMKGEWTNFNLSEVSTNSWLGLTYLIIFGSIVGFTAYSWLLKNSAPSLVATYAYVNPVIAVFLGWLIAGESLSLQMLVGAAVIISSVALITSTSDSKKSEESEIETSQCPSFSTSS